MGKTVYPAKVKESPSSYDQIIVSAR